MPRSLKKGPFVDDHLLKKVDDLNDQGREERRQDVVAAAPRSSPTWSATPSPCTTGASTCPCTSPSRWSATSSASSRRPARSATTPARRRPCEAGGSRWAFGVKTNERPGTRAQVRYVRMSAYKAREVLDLIRGKEVAAGRRDPAVLPSATRPIVDPQVPRRRRWPTPRTTTASTPTSCTCRRASPTRARRSSAGVRVPAAGPRASASARATSP